MTLSDMDYIRGAIAQAIVEQFTFVDVWNCAEHAATPKAFNRAVNELAHITPEKTT